MFLMRLLKRKAGDDQSFRRNVRPTPLTNDEATDEDHSEETPSRDKWPPSSTTSIIQEGSKYNATIAASDDALVWLGNNITYISGSEQRISRSEPKTWLERLRFGHMERRRVQLNRDLPAPGTCQWLFENEQFYRWENEPPSLGSTVPILILKGKPGSGKSVLCHSALKRCEVLPKVVNNDLLTLGFFFNARDKNLLEQTSEGFYRSLICQLLLKLPTQSCDDNILNKFTLPEKDDFDVDVLRQVLLELLLAAKNQLVAIFIDAIDECHGYGQGKISHVDHVLKFLHDLSASHLALRVCLTTQNEASVQKHLSLFHLIDVEAYNKPEIESYMKAELKKISQISPYLQSELLKILSRRCSNMFLWAKLVLEQIDHTARYSPEVKNILKEVETTPQQLHDIYSTRLKALPSGSRAQAVILFQFVQAAVRPLTVPELQSALYCASASADSKSSLSQRREELSVESFGHRLYHLSGGLIEMTAPLQPHWSHPKEDLKAPPIVRFIHKTVTDFLDRGGIEVIDPTIDLGPDAVAYSHLQVATLCMQTLDTRDAAVMAASRDRADVRTAFLQYACQFWTLHARRSNNIMRENFEPPTNLILCQPRVIFALFRKFQTPEVFAFSEDIPNHHLLKCNFNGAICSRSPDVQYCQDNLLVLLAFEGCTKLFSHHVSGCLQGTKCHENQHILERAFFCSVHRGWIDTTRSVWDLASQRGIELDINMHFSSERPFTALYIACYKGKTDVVKFLLQKGADPLARSNMEYMFPLHAASAQGHLEILQLLLRSSVSVVKHMLSEMINTKSEKGGTALHLAADFGRSAIVEEILKCYQKHDIKYLIHAQFGMTRTALEIAEANMSNPELSMVLRRASFEEIIRRLKEYGSDDLERI